ERFRFGCSGLKCVRPGCFKVKGVSQDEACIGGQRITRDEGAEKLSCLFKDPGVDFFPPAPFILFEIHLLPRRAIMIFHQIEKSLAKLVSFLSEQSIGNGEGDRFLWTT